MSSATLPRESIAGYGMAVAIIAMGVFFAGRTGVPESTMVMRMACFSAALLVTHASFVWGGARGFQARDAEGRICIAHVIRNSVMSALAFVMAIIIASPFMALAHSWAR